MVVKHAQIGFSVSCHWQPDANMLRLLNGTMKVALKVHDAVETTCLALRCLVRTGSSQ